MYLRKLEVQPDTITINLQDSKDIRRLTKETKATGHIV